MLRFYLTPEIGGSGAPVGNGEVDSLRPAYIGNMDGIAWTAMKFGAEPVRLVACDLSAFDHNFVATRPDVFAFPDDIDQPIPGNQVNTIRAAWAAKNIPDHWINASMTYREVLRMTGRIFQFPQRLRGIHLNRGEAPTRIFGGGRHLGSNHSELPQGLQNDFRDAANSMRISRASHTPAAPMRTILKAMGDGFTGPIYIGVLI